MRFQTLNRAGLLAGLVTVAMGLLTPLLAQGAPDNVWIGGVSVSWDDAGNWSLGHVPSSQERAVLNGGTVSAGNVICAELALQAGTLTLDQSLGAPAATVSNGATLFLAGDSVHTITGTLTNHGALFWQGGDIDGDSYSSNGHIINAPDGVFEILCDRALGASLSFENEGAIYKNLGTNPNFTSFGAKFANSGSISVRAGTLNIERVVDLSGSASAADGTAIRLNAYSSTPVPITLQSTTTGTGDIRLSGSFAGTLSGQARLVMGLGGNLTIAPASTVAIGDQSGESTFRLTGTLTNHGTLLWQYGSINGDSLASLTGHIINATDGVIDIWCDKTLGSFLTLDNKGRLFKNRGDPASFTHFGAEFANSGSISVRAGTLNIERIVDLSGSLSAANGTTVRINAYSSTSAPITLQSTTAGSGDVRLSGNFTGTLSGQARLVMGIEGNLSIAPSSTVAIGDQSGESTFRLTGTLTNHGTLLWQSSSIDGDSNSSRYGHIVNATDGIIDIWCDKPLGSFLTLDNKGHLFKNRGDPASFTHFGAEFANSGSVSVNAGTLNIERIVDLSGSVSAADGTTIHINAYSSTPAPITLQSTTAGSGDVRLSGNFTGTLSGSARLVMGIKGNLTIAPSSTVAIGDQLGDSTFYLTGTLTNHGSLLWQYGSIDGDSYSARYGHIVNETDGVIDIWCDKTLGSFLTLDNKGRLFKNRGDPASFTHFGAEFANSGSISVNAGTLNIERIVDLSGSLSAADGTTVRINAYSSTSAPITLQSTTAGSGDVRLSGNFTGTLSGQARLVMGIEGNLAIAPSSTVAIGDQSGDSTFRLTGILTNHGTLLWQYGSIDGDSYSALTGHIVNESDGVIDLWSDKSLGSALTFDNRGSIYKNHGELTSINCPFQNKGRIELRSGTLSFSQAFQQTSGATKLAGGDISTTAPTGLRILGGELTGAGAIIGHVTLSGGSISPGDAKGAPLCIDGNLELAATATLVSTAKGTALTDFGRLVVSGNTILAGNLAFSLGNGFVPTLGNRFQVIRSASISGSFAHATFPAQPAATDYFVHYGNGFAEIVTGVTTFADWQALHFGATTDPAIIGDNADPDSDGLANLLEYALGLDPLGASRVGLPGISVQTADNGMAYLTMVFTSPATLTDIVLQPQVSEDLVNWRSGTGNIVTVSDTATDGLRTMVVRDATPVSSGPRRFMHLQVQLVR